MPFDIGALGQGLATGLTGMALQGGLNQMQQSQNQALLQQQTQAQEQIMDYGYQKQMDFWNATNYPAQVQQLEKAGLNPALLYAKGGPGGQTGSPVTGAGGSQTQPQGMGIQAAQTGQLLQAQIDIIS